MMNATRRKRERLIPHLPTTKDEIDTDIRNQIWGISHSYHGEQLLALYNMIEVYRKLHPPPKPVYEDPPF